MLTADEVYKVFIDCLYRNEEVESNVIPEGAVVVKGLKATFCFHPERLEMHREDIKAFISELPETFKEGWSFLNICTTKDNQQWGQHQNGEQLLALGIASKLMNYCAPRDLWPSLPGGMPYVQVLK